MIASALKLCSNSHTVQHCTKNVQRSHATMHETCKCDTATSCQLVFCKINLEPATMMKLCESNPYPSDLYVDLFLVVTWTSCLQLEFQVYLCKVILPIEVVILQFYIYCINVSAYTKSTIGELCFVLMTLSLI